MLLLVSVFMMELMKCCTLLVFSNGTVDWNFVWGQVNKDFGMWNVSKFSLTELNWGLQRLLLETETSAESNQVKPRLS